LPSLERIGHPFPRHCGLAMARRDGAMILDARLTLRTHDGALINMTYGGRWIIPRSCMPTWGDPVRRYQVDPSRYYFRTNPLFETDLQDYAWVNDLVCVGSGYLVEGAVAYRVDRVI
jgi:hypothetical protein